MLMAQNGGIEMKEYNTDDKISKNAIKKMVTGFTQRRWVKSTDKEVRSDFKPIAITTLYDGGAMVVTQAIKHQHIHYYAAESDTQKLRWAHNLKNKTLMNISIINTEKIKARQKAKEDAKNAEE